MKPNHSRILRFALALFGSITLALVLWGNEPNPSSDHTSLVTDWSHHHLIFSNPSDIQKAIQVRKDPRFWQQWLRRNVRVSLPASEADTSDATLNRTSGGGSWLSILWGRGGSARGRMHRDWSVSMGNLATVGQINYPAKYTFDTSTASCANDFVVYNTGVDGSDTQATVIAYNNIYSGCSGLGAVPETYWSYNTGSGAKVTTSVALSYDGSQVAFVQDQGSAASLVLLKWSSTGALSTVSNSAYPTCTVPCMTTISFNGGAIDTNSSPFYDFGDDTIYVGDDKGSLHKFTPVFNGMPAEVTTGGWPAASPNMDALTSPVYDQASAQVFVADMFDPDDQTGGYLYRVNATGTPTFTASGQLGVADTDFTDAPIVDSTAGELYVFVSDAGPNGQGACGGANVCSAVYQLPTNFATGTTGDEAEMGIGATTPNAIYDGDFDNTYYTSANSTGNLCACGNAGGFPALYEITITNGAMASGAATTGPTLTTESTRCSPLTEFFNANIGGGTDYLFLSVETSGLMGNGCTVNEGCIMTFTLTGTPINGSTVATAGLEAGDGTSGITIDNDAAGGGSEVYFTPLENTTCTTSGVMGGCATQATQSALQ